MSTSSYDNCEDSLSKLNVYLKKNVLLPVCLNLEYKLCDKGLSYSDKASVLLSTLESVCIYSTVPPEKPDIIEKVLEFCYPHTINILLRQEWTSLKPLFKTRISVTLNRCSSQFRLYNMKAAKICDSLLRLVDSPWCDPTLVSIINDNFGSNTDILKFYQNESEYLLAVRLEMLIRENSDDLALRLAESCIKYIPLINTVPTLHFICIKDIYLSLLFSGGRILDVVNHLKKINLRDGVKLIQRFKMKKVGVGISQRVVKYSLKLAEIASIIFFAVAVHRPITNEHCVNCIRKVVSNWLNLQICVHKSEVNHITMIQDMCQKIFLSAESSQHMYIVCQVICIEFGHTLKTFCIKLYVHALTVNMNEVEEQRVLQNDKKVREAEIQLASGFLQLADLVEDNVEVCRECVLTAFSLNPTKQCFDRIKYLALFSEKNIQVLDKTKTLKNETVEENSLPLIKSLEANDKYILNSLMNENDNMLDINVNFASLYEVVSENIGEKLEFCNGDDFPWRTAESLRLNNIRRKNITSFQNCVQYSNCNELPLGKTRITFQTLFNIAKSESLHSDIFSPLNQVIDADALGISPELCNDLTIVISSPRYKILSWKLDWMKLSYLCEMYLAVGEEVRYATRELKFLNIDYDIFKNWPSINKEELFYIIEKGVHIGPKGSLHLNNTNAVTEQ